jgi:hypothetical protein
VTEERRAGRRAGEMAGRDERANTPFVPPSVKLLMAAHGPAPRRMKWLVGWRRLSGGTEVVVPSGVEQPAMKFDREPREPLGLSLRVCTRKHVS